MHGLISDRPLLISSLLEHAARYHGKTEIISADSKDKITRSNYENVNTISNNNGDIKKLLYKLDSTHINSYFSIRNIENNKCFVHHSSAYTLSYWRYESDDINFLFTFELIGQTPKSIKNRLRNHFKNTWKMPLNDY